MIHVADYYPAYTGPQVTVISLPSLKATASLFYNLHPLCLIIMRQDIIGEQDNPHLEEMVKLNSKAEQDAER